jgi:two-component sensor histidine kinase
MTTSIPPEAIVAGASIYWHFPPPTALASSVREFLSGLYGPLLDADEVFCVAMTAHELLENLTKYSVDGTSTFDVALRQRANQTYICIRTSNCCHPDRLDDVRQLVDRIRATTNPLTVYDELIVSSPDRAGSGLGLARIRAEADMEVACFVEGRQVTITAERRVTIRRPRP